MKLSISKKGWLLLAAGTFVILLASLGANYSEQQSKQNRLEEDLYLAQQRLDRYSAGKLLPRQEEQEDQLAQIQAELTATKNCLRQPIGSIAVSETLFAAVAESSNVEVIEVRSSSPVSKKRGEITFLAQPLTAMVEGDLPNLVSFVLKLSQEFPTNVVESIEISIPEVTEGEEIIKSTALVRLVIYTYQGD